MNDQRIALLDREARLLQADLTSINPNPRARIKGMKSLLRFSDKKISKVFAQTIVLIAEANLTDLSFGGEPW